MHLLKNMHLISMCADINHTLILVELEQQQYSDVYSYSQIALAFAHAITNCTRARKSTDYCLNCTWKCMINYT